ncbi:RNA polymerase sigma factor [Kribbella sp. VKM Ac-2571]|uniref:RNA polymerase sigma factor n=1 Tax=Kribbella sp. VKM Ac-2571 TaxID=2512222 RepID=UPI00192E09FF|nr:sigma-70 family RNA polymerase sigma factor [Kribbella sp. VKM Ac-2571]
MNGVTPFSLRAGDAEAEAWATSSDATLRRAAALGDVEAFAVIIDRHGPSMFRYARRMLNDQGDAEEVVQDAFVAAWKALPDFRGDAPLRTWLFTITGRKAVDLFRKKRAVPVEETTLTDLAAPGTDPAGQAVEAGLLDALGAALADLPWLQRAIWLLREVEQMSYIEIAIVLSTSPTVVRGQLARARATLKHRLEAWR